MLVEDIPPVVCVRVRVRVRHRMRVCVTLCRPCKSRFVSSVSVSDAESAVRARGRVRRSVSAPRRPRRASPVPTPVRSHSPAPAPLELAGPSPVPRRAHLVPGVGRDGPGLRPSLHPCGRRRRGETGEQRSVATAEVGHGRAGLKSARSAVHGRAAEVHGRAGHLLVRVAGGRGHGGGVGVSAWE